MKLNGIRCDGYTQRGKDWWVFTLSETTIEDAAALDGQDLVVTDDEGETVASFAGYAVMGVERLNDSVVLTAARALEPAAEEAIEAVEANVSVLSKQMETVSSKADAAQTAADTAQAAANPQVVTFARMAVAPMAADMTVSEGASVSTLWPEKKVGDVVNLKDFFWYGGELYRCNQPELTITAGQEPDKNLPALYGHIAVASDGILIWDADDLTGAPDIYNTGVKVHHPDADGPIYVSKRDGNTSEPGTDEWWGLAE